ncbi:MAG: hypothetical protein ACI9JN_000539 [Bacteroidia bacterium]|jgi:hypothetical protein
MVNSKKIFRNNCLKIIVISFLLCFTGYHIVKTNFLDLKVYLIPSECSNAIVTSSEKAKFHFGNDLGIDEYIYEVYYYYNFRGNRYTGSSYATTFLNSSDSVEIILLKNYPSMSILTIGSANPFGWYSYFGMFVALLLVTLVILNINRLSEIELFTKAMFYRKGRIL